jgi:putative oxidoreductase
MTADTTPFRISAALTILRVALGGIFAAHGAQKLFVYGLGGVTGAFSHMGVPLPGLVGPVVAFLEFFGGLALVAGLLARSLGLLLALEMVGAMLIVHLKNGFFLPGGVEFVLALFAGALALALAGAGDYSLDRIIAERRARR